MKFFFSTCIVLLSGIQIALARQLPLAQISDPSCKSMHWDAHTWDCKIDFTLPDETVFSSPKNATEKLLFSVLYKWSYHDGHTLSGGHPGIDIVSAKGTPLYSIAHGEVTKAWWINGYGNTVVVKHTDGIETVYSNYAHMDTIEVAEWDNITEWQKLWEIGNTWFTMWANGNHVDFQITTDTSPSHPYGHTACPQWYREATQTGVCNTILDQYTLDPLAFLSSKISGTHSRNPELPELHIWSLDLESAKNNLSDEAKLLIEQIKIKDAQKKLLDSVEKPHTQKVEVWWETDVVIKKNVLAPKYYVGEQPYKINAILSHTLMGVDLFGKLSLEVTKDKLPVNETLDHPVTIGYDSDIIQIYWSDITMIMNGKKQLLYKSKQPWKTPVKIMIDGKIVRTWVITVQ